MKGILTAIYVAIIVIIFEYFAKQITPNLRLTIMILVLVLGILLIYKKVK